MSEKNSRKAFDIGRIPKNLDLSSPPVTGFDYLYRVRLETRKCPKVVVSNLDTSKYLSRQTVQVDPFNGFVRARPGFEPDPEWQEDQLETFIQTRLEVFQNREEMKKKFPKRDFPKIADEQGWCKFCLGDKIHGKIFNSNRAETKDSVANSRDKIIQNYNTGSRESTADSLGSFVSKKSKDGTPQDNSKKIASDSSVATSDGSTAVSDTNVREKKGVRSFTPSSTTTSPDAEPKSKRSRSNDLDASSEGHPPLLSIVLHLNQTRITRLLAFHINWLEGAGFCDAQGRWLYALLMCLEKPLDPGDCAMLRSLARKCSELRNGLTDPKDSLVMSINLVLSIIARFFDQKDMSDGFLME